MPCERFCRRSSLEWCPATGVVSTYAAASRRAAGMREGYRAPEAVRGATSGSAAITAELKSMSVDELKAAGGHYQNLLAARDLEDVLYGSG